MAANSAMHNALVQATMLFSCCFELSNLLGVWRHPCAANSTTNWIKNSSNCFNSSCEIQTMSGEELNESSHHVGGNNSPWMKKNTDLALGTTKLILHVIDVIVYMS